MTEVTEQMHNIHKSCEEDMKIKLDRASEANQQILNRLTIVFGKLDLLMRQLGIAQVDKNGQDQLINAQKACLHAVNNPQDGLLRKLDNARRKADVVSVSHNEAQPERIDKQVVTDSDIRDILRVLQKQSAGMKVLKSSI